jgi:AmmeMemoRadiSam system protein B
MSLRRRYLPRGWYPDDPERLRALAASWAGALDPSLAGSAVAAVAPHAGWTFSGSLAAKAVSSLALPKPAASRPSEPPTLAVFGGHLPRGARPLAARESSFETPLGPLQADLELRGALDSSLGPALGLGSDDEGDNTVEVLLPLVAALLPGVRVLWLRAPNDESSIELGRALFAAASSLGREIACLGSTDLTHYGPNYGFAPKGRGAAAEAWVRGTNDRRFVDALLALDGKAALALGEAERSACSPGAAVAALAFALSCGASDSRLIDYATSLDVRQDDSFVGYAAIAFKKEPT